MCTWLWAPCAAASSIDTQSKAAHKACLSGDVAAGVAILADLFVETKDPTFVYNQARCFEQNGRHGEAINRFREYLRIAPDLSAEIQALVKDHIADCRAIIDKSGSDPGEPTGAEQPPRIRDTDPQPEPRLSKHSEQPQSDPMQAEAALPSPSNSGGGLRTAGVIFSALGGASILAGVVLNLKANSMADDLEKAGAYSRRTESTRADYETFAKFGYGIGGACLVGGAILYMLGWPPSAAPESQVAVLPTIGPDTMGATLKGAF